LIILLSQVVVLAVVQTMQVVAVQVVSVLLLASLYHLHLL
jgi:hypothetical protein